MFRIKLQYNNELKRHSVPKKTTVAFEDLVTKSKALFKIPEQTDIYYSYIDKNNSPSFIKNQHQLNSLLNSTNSDLIKISVETYPSSPDNVSHSSHNIFSNNSQNINSNNSNNPLLFDKSIQLEQPSPKVNSSHSNMKSQNSPTENYSISFIKQVLSNIFSKDINQNIIKQHLDTFKNNPPLDNSLQFKKTSESQDLYKFISQQFTQIANQNKYVYKPSYFSDKSTNSNEDDEEHEHKYFLSKDLNQKISLQKIKERNRIQGNYGDKSQICLSTYDNSSRFGKDISIRNINRHNNYISTRSGRKVESGKSEEISVFKNINFQESVIEN